MKRQLALTSVAALAASLITLTPGSAGAGRAHVAADEVPPVSVADTVEHLQAFQDIADANAGNRRTGTPGYAASLDYVKNQLDEAGFETTVQEFTGTDFGGRPVEGTNLIADLPGGDESNTVMVGAHLDSIYAGINDNGTGSAGTLELARTLAESGVEPDSHVRFAWWDAEEVGLVGSRAYVDSLSDQEVGDIASYLNFDMIASPNYGIFVYDDNPDGDPLRDKLTGYFDATGMPWEYVDPQGRSDHYGFIEAGIPTAGLFTGADGLPADKTEEQVEKWGGTVGSWDPCYHQVCDDMSNFSEEGLAINLGAMADLVWDEAGFGDGDEEPVKELVNGGFEGRSGWAGATRVITDDQPRLARTGKGKAWFARGKPAGANNQATVNQTVSITPDARRLTLWVRVDAKTKVKGDRLRIQVVAGGKAKTLATLTVANRGKRYRKHTFDLGAYQGSDVTLRLASTNHKKGRSSFLVDDVSLS